MKQLDLLEVLNHIDPSTLDYTSWVNVGMALKHEGYMASDWDNWSRSDSRYHDGECFNKWNSFVGTGSPVTGGTITQMAKDRGMTFGLSKGEGHALDWDSTINDDHVFLDPGFIEGKPIYEPYNWQPKREIIRYLEALFDVSENVGYVTETYEKDGRYLPKKGFYDRTAGELIEQLNNCEEISEVLGDYNTEAGAWIRFNPLDGKGIKNDNVTDYKYALVEDDTSDLEKQNALLHELELPIVALVYSGGKSVHAIVRVDAASYSEYRKRVDYLYQICNKNGLNVDIQNKNPSRLSRLPGIERNGKKQFLIDTNIGKADWNEWYEWIESINDDLPEPEDLSTVWDNMPELAPPLIHNVLRQGHKMLIAGPSKAGKSFALIEMCIAIAEGAKWIGQQCSQGRILYINLELDRASCLHRFKDVYQAMDLRPQNMANIDIWNLRGKTLPMDKLAPKLIRRAAKKDYIAIVIDPIYKVITGDENSADQMALFCNQFDKVATELKAAVIYCHHHSKGSQGNKKSMDRASGSGVFARDPDALLDLIQLDLTDTMIDAMAAKKMIDLCRLEFEKNNVNWDAYLSYDDSFSLGTVIEATKSALGYEKYLKLDDRREEIKRELHSISAWRIEGTLREFPKFDPIDLWFKYPVHEIDDIGVLKNIDPEEVKPAWQKAKDNRKSPGEKKKGRTEELELAYDTCNTEGEVTVKDISEYLGVTERTVQRRVKESKKFTLDSGLIMKK